MQTILGKLKKRVGGRELLQPLVTDQQCFGGKEPACQRRRHKRCGFDVRTSGSGRSPGEGNGNRLQYSCRGDPMGRGAWRTIVHRVAQSRARLCTHNIKAAFCLFLPGLDTSWQSMCPLFPKGGGAHRTPPELKHGRVRGKEGNFKK